MLNFASQYQNINKTNPNSKTNLKTLTDSLHPEDIVPCSSIPQKQDLYQTQKVSQSLCSLAQGGLNREREQQIQTNQQQQEQAQARQTQEEQTQPQIQQTQLQEPQPQPQPQPHQEQLAQQIEQREQTQQREHTQQREISLNTDLQTDTKEPKRDLSSTQNSTSFLTNSTPPFKRSINYLSPITSTTSIDLQSLEEANKEKTLWKKTKERIKNWGKKIVDKTTQIITATQNAFAKLSDQGQLDLIKSHIKLEQMVYQSVPAPQIEPLDEQENTINKDGFPVFSSYDLVQGKPAGVLVGIKKRTNNPLNIQRNLKVKMWINSEQTKAECLNGLTLSGHYNSENKIKPSSDLCSFEVDFTKQNKKEDFLHNYLSSVFIKIPTGIIFTVDPKHAFSSSATSRTHSITIKLIDADTKTEISSVDFDINLIESRSLKVGVVGVDATCDKMDLSAHNHLTRDYMKSAEVTDVFKDIFPIRREGVSIDFLKQSDIKDYKVRDLVESRFGYNPVIQGDCDTEFKTGKEYSKGIKETFNTGDIITENADIDKMVMLASENYLRYHNFVDHHGNPVFGGIIRHNIFSHFGINPPSAIVNTSSINKGALLHEISHTLGQYDEFYDKTKQCKEFKNSKEHPCHDHEFSRGLKTSSDGHFYWVTKYYSIMSAQGDGGVDSLWIDRETYQKAFAYLTGSLFFDRFNWSNNVLGINPESEPSIQLAFSFEEGAHLKGGIKIIPPHTKGAFWGHNSRLLNDMAQQINKKTSKKIEYIKFEIIDQDNSRVLYTTNILVNRSEWGSGVTSNSINMPIVKGITNYQIRSLKGVLSIENGQIFDQIDYNSVKTASFTYADTK